MNVALGKRSCSAAHPTSRFSSSVKHTMICSGLAGSPERRPMLRAPGVWSPGRVHGLVRGLGLGIVGEGGVGADACHEAGDHGGCARDVGAVRCVDLEPPDGVLAVLLQQLDLVQALGLSVLVDILPALKGGDS